MFGKSASQIGAAVNRMEKKTYHLVVEKLTSKIIRLFEARACPDEAIVAESTLNGERLGGVFLTQVTRSKAPKVGTKLAGKLAVEMKQGAVETVRRKFREDLVEAANAGREALRSEKALKYGDGGSSNFDSLAVWGIPLNDGDIRSALDHAGLSGHWASGRLWRGAFLIGPAVGGYQGYLRTYQIEAMEKFLKSRGWRTNVYYQMD